MTKTNKKNIFLGLGITGILATVFGTSAALYFSAGTLENIANKREYVIRSNTPLTLDGYYFDTTSSYGTASSKSTQSLMNANAIRIQTTGETKFSNIDNKSIVISPSYSKLVLELAQELILTFENSANDIQQFVFNSDEANIIPKFSSKTLIPETVSLLSDNPESINSDNFKKLLNGKASLENGVLKPNLEGEYSLKSFGLTVKEDAFWVDSNGKQTKYKIHVKDFYYSYMRTWLFDTHFRRANGGSTDLDKYFIKESGTSTKFLEDNIYPNDYLFNLFGIDSKMIQNEEETIKKVNIKGVEKNAFTISALDSQTIPTNFDGLLSKIFLDSYLIPAAPSEFIDELVLKNKDIEYGEKNEKITGLAEKFGIYTYGQKRNDNLFASAYIPISGANNKIIFRKNNYFANEEFTKDEATLLQIIFEFSTSPTYGDQLFTNYFEKTVSEMPYTDFTQQQKIKIFGTSGSDEEAIDNGLLQVKQLNKTQLVQRTLLSTDPATINDPKKEKYYFNEEYAKIMYGSTIEKLASGKATTANSFFNGSGFELRTLLNASINWYTFINNSWKGSKALWLNHTAPNAKYNSTTSADASPIDFINELNSICYFDGIEKITITENDMKKQFTDNLNDSTEQFKTHKFKKIKSIIEKLLDKENVTKDKPLVWAISYPWADAAGQTQKIIQLEKIVEIIKSIDDRLQPHLLIPSTRDELLNFISRNKGISDFNGWGYDYEGIGSYLDGISHGKGISLLGAFSLYSNKENANLRARHPEFTKLSDDMFVELNDELPAGKKITDWINFTNKNNNQIDSYFGSEYKISTELAKFFLHYQEKISTEQITNLIIELNTIAGFAMESDNSINDPNATSLSLVLLEYYYPTTKSGILYLSDVRIGDKND